MSKNRFFLTKILNRIFIEGLTGMAYGLFATLIIGTIFNQIGILIGGQIGYYLSVFGLFAQKITGAGIGVGVAVKFLETNYVVLAACASGMIGAFGSKIISDEILINGALKLDGPGEPLGAFVAVIACVLVAELVAGKTKVDLILTPAVGILSGGIVGVLAGPPISGFMKWLGSIINYGTKQQPILMGIIVAVTMGMILTLPISSAALGIILGLNGIAAGAATIGCCCQMIGFAVISFKDNGIGGFFAQGVGTSMLQVPNIIRKPVIWLPPIIASAILGPIGIMPGIHIVNNAAGSGMGTSGLVGPIMSFNTMINSMGTLEAILKIAIFEFVLPAILSLGIFVIMRKIHLIKDGDMRI